jgi:ribosomal silencing factor RsfS
MLARLSLSLRCISKRERTLNCLMTRLTADCGQSRFKSTSSPEDRSNGKDLPPSKRQFQPFADEHELILDFDEEKQEQDLNYQQQIERQKLKFQSITRDRSDQSEPATITSTVTSEQLIDPLPSDPVFDVATLTDILRAERLQDLLVIELPAHLNYAEHLILATAANERHLRNSIQQVRREYKRRRVARQQQLNPDPDEAADWQALDMRNIVLHIFTEATRVRYDVDSLWAVGPEFDELTQRPDQDASVSMLERHIRFLDNLQPINRQ